MFSFGNRSFPCGIPAFQNISCMFLIELAIFGFLHVLVIFTNVDSFSLSFSIPTERQTFQFTHKYISFFFFPSTWMAVSCVPFTKRRILVGFCLERFVLVFSTFVLFGWCQCWTSNQRILVAEHTNSTFLPLWAMLKHKFWQSICILSTVLLIKYPYHSAEGKEVIAQWTTFIPKLL